MSMINRFRVGAFPLQHGRGAVMSYFFARHSWWRRSYPCISLMTGLHATHVVIGFGILAVIA